MKLRIRSLKSKDSIDLEVPDTHTVRELKEIIFSCLSNGGSSSPVSRGQLFLTLNRKDELSGSSLHSADVATGDVLFYSLNPDAGDQIDNSGKLKSSVGQSSAKPNFGGRTIGAFINAQTKELLRSNAQVSGNRTGGRILEVAVHSVLLEFGFVGYDPISRAKLDAYRLPDRCPSPTLYYTVPELLSSNPVQCVALKFQTMGKFLNIVGILNSNGVIHRICLDGYPNEEIGFQRLISRLSRFVKDRFAFPLLIDLRESAGLPPPPCFMLLPAELKLTILELLPGTDIARMACVCKELKAISSNEELWKQKFEQRLATLTNKGTTNCSSTSLRFWRRFEHRVRTFMVNHTGFSWKSCFSRCISMEQSKQACPQPELLVANQQNLLYLKQRFGAYQHNFMCHHLMGRANAGSGNNAFFPVVCTQCQPVQTRPYPFNQRPTVQMQSNRREAHRFGGLDGRLSFKPVQQMRVSLLPSQASLR